MKVWLLVNANLKSVATQLLTVNMIFAVEHAVAATYLPDG